MLPKSSNALKSNKMILSRIIFFKKNLRFSYILHTKISSNNKEIIIIILYFLAKSSKDIYIKKRERSIAIKGRPLKSRTTRAGELRHRRLSAVLPGMVGSAFTLAL